ncbi:MAG: ATP-binding protein [Cyanobacteria bacterium P01_D01_bin.44]
MPRWFNTAGPCNPSKHYMLSPTERLPSWARLIDQESYFVLHAPRQTGKTTAMLALAEQLTQSGRYAAVVLSVEVGAPITQDLDQAEQAILSAWKWTAQVRLPRELHPPEWSQLEPGARLRQALQQWAQISPRPLVIFIDEIDALQDDVLLSTLRQLRDGYPNRPEAFPQSVALVGLRDVRDYKVAAGGSGRLNTASPFNIKVRSFTLRNFTVAEVGHLYAQHTQDTGQAFTAAAQQRAFELSQGQPWLVNALAKEAVEELVNNASAEVTADLIEQAKEHLIQRQDTHLDSLAERLRESRVRTIIEPMIAGQDLGNVAPDDIQYVLDLGLCRLDERGGLVIANPIYREILPKMLAFTTVASLGYVNPTWLTPEGQLDVQQLLESFLTFWRQHGQPLFASAPYHEIAPHIVLMAFLHRVVNGGGTLEREYAIGTDRLDLCLRYGEVTLAMELKVWREGRPDPLKAGLKQLDKYLIGLGLKDGWLVIFDRRDRALPIAERTMTEAAATSSGRQVTVIRG